ncbi:MAG: GNAT family N-acetyltransferase [Clostridium sp.]|uniref:GNAT family N-acetyltransferase n=1 Tax=Clostridium sp. TaxID=1506 RepID=UPI003D6D4495
MDNYQHSILMKLELNEQEYEAIKNLEAVCYEEQKTNLKLELDFKMHQMKNSIKNKSVAEFLYYENEILIGYLGLCNFGGNTVEVSGMVHPKFRRKGIFRKLYLIAKEEWQRTCPSEVLLLCDHTSISGLAFINDIGAEYGSSEYKMCLNKKNLELTHTQGIKLRLATNEDAAEIDRQSSIYFGLLEKEDEDKESEEDTEKLSIQGYDNFINYMAELAGEIIGKIHINIVDNEGFIYGFGVLPEYRGKGYGREVLCLALDILKKKQVDNIFLEVATENKNALGLYESCGFEEISVMDYYVVS